MTTALICLVAAFFLGMGVFALAAPAAILRPFGFVIETPQTRSEVRAVYGGFGIAIASVLVAALANAHIRPGILMTVGAALAGMALGRVISRLVDASTPLYPVWFYFLVETVGASATFAAAIMQN
jgi:hypothetical protein